MANKMLHISPWGADDTTIVIAWLFQNGFLGGGIVAGRLGIGRDVWGLDESRILKIIELFLAFELLYTITLGLIKVSICFFYMRLFPDRIVRRCLWATQVFNVLLVCVFLIVDLTQCKPLSWFWNRLDQDTTKTGTCIDINGMTWAHAIINIALDLWMLALPATQILGLQMALAKKLHVLAMFALGAFLTLVSCIRLRSLIAFAKTQNPTQDFYDISLWSAIELTTGVVVACLPAVRQTLVRYGPSLRTIVSDYASRISVADRTARSNAKSRSADTQDNDQTSSKRRLHQRLSDEIPMSAFSPREVDRARYYGHDDLSSPDSTASTFQGSSANAKSQKPIRIEAFLKSKASIPDVTRTI
ncbi:hypothetical protein N0V93_005793 [Gnomoniopsis smithogilvyi]|uniref:Rhodopsin domain-containing protein n=1 Tax=Gnomoniopsis smithogilvyi TaxID=1191159 RepID=A0A9W8YW91_9PEZI|nr:hypothetical protein N0V93_005793 [Gnomoniopsis smithogilvyi]